MGQNFEELEARPGLRDSQISAGLKGLTDPSPSTGICGVPSPVSNLQSPLPVNLPDTADLRGSGGEGVENRARNGAGEGGKGKTETLSLDAVIDRIDRATGPDHALAAHMHCALRGYSIHEDTDPASGSFAFWEGVPWNSLCSNCSSWVDPATEIDEAIGMLPKGWRLQHLGQEHKFARWLAQISKDGSDENPLLEDDICFISRMGNTAALAILHVALLAHKERLAA